MMWYGFGNVGWVGWTVMALSMVAFWGLVVWAVVALVRSTSGSDNKPPTGPEEILARRFAAGDIDATAYQQSRSVLSGKTLVDH